MSESIPLECVVDLGPVGDGASQARFFQAENGTEYLVKSPALSKNNKYVCANEIIASSLAISLGLPSLEWRLLSFAQELYFGCQKVDFAPRFFQKIFDQCKNKARAYDMVAFDIFVINRDRHDGNIMARKVQKKPDQYVLLMIDHSHALVFPGRTVNDLTEDVEYVSEKIIKSSIIKTALTDPDLFDSSVSSISSISDYHIEHAVNQVPTIWLADSEKDILVSFLKQRRDRFPQICSRFKDMIKLTKEGLDE